METLIQAAQADNPRQAFLEYASLGRFDAIPGFTELASCEQNPEWHSEGTVLVHVSYVFEHAVRLLREYGFDLHSREARLILADVVWHDSQKAAAFDEIEGRITAFKHDKLGAKTALAHAGEVLGFDEDDVKALAWLVGAHMEAHVMPSWPKPKMGPTPRLAYYLNVLFILLQLFEEADSRGSQRLDGTWGMGNRAFFEAERPGLLAEYAKKQIAKARGERVARALLQTLGKKRSQEVGPLKQQVLDILGDGEFDESQLASAIAQVVA